MKQEDEEEEEEVKQGDETGGGVARGGEDMVSVGSARRVSLWLAAVCCSSPS